MRRTNSETLDILSQWSHLVETREDIAEEIETLMLRLETVFKSYHDKTIVNNHQKQTMREFDGGSWELQQIVAEIADQIQVRPYRNRCPLTLRNLIKKMFPFLCRLRTV